MNKLEHLKRKMILRLVYEQLGLFETLEFRRGHYDEYGLLHICLPSIPEK